ncbi:MAG TPA: NAD(P)-dependent glycerol-1-phosphate dehydrogenase [Nitrososphaerales archaeon]
MSKSNALDHEKNRHEMDLPKSILIGDYVLEELGSFLQVLGCHTSVHIISGSNVLRKVKGQVEESLRKSNVQVKWSQIHNADIGTVQRISKVISKTVNMIIGIGGGKSVDVAKLVAYNVNIPFISIPTCASHDGISSPFASIQGSEKPYSFAARAPLGIIADLNVISDAPPRLIASGCGDLVGKITAVRDWEIANEDTKEYFGKYAASLARLSADLVISDADNIGLRGKDSVRDVVEALISAGVAAGIAGSSRPCSGSEHLFAHSLSILSSNKGLHGEKVGLGTILIAKLQGEKWDKIVRSLEIIRAPTKAVDIGISDKLIVKALLSAREIRPDRYTILNRMKLDEQKAISLARATNVI